MVDLTYQQRIERSMTFKIFLETTIFFIKLLDCKDQNEFQYDIDQILKWFLGTADIKKWT